MFVYVHQKCVCIYIYINKGHPICFFDMCFTDLVSEFSHRTNLHIRGQKTRGALAFHSRGNTVGTDHAPMAREWDAGMTSDKKLCRIFVSSAPLQDQQPTLCCKPKLRECGANSLFHFSRNATAQAYRRYMDFTLQKTTVWSESILACLSAWLHPLPFIGRK